MPVAGEGYRRTLGNLALFITTILPTFSLLLYTLRSRTSSHIKRSTRSLLPLFLMYLSVLCTIPFSLIERDPYNDVSCLVYKLCAILHIPLWTTPLIGSQLHFFREARIHAKLASVANEVMNHNPSDSTSSAPSTPPTPASPFSATLTHNPLRRNKATFDHLLDALKRERRNLRKNLITTYSACLAVYGITFLVFFISNSNGLSDMFSHGGDISNTNTNDDSSPFYIHCTLNRGIFFLDLAYGFIGQIATGMFVYYFRKGKLKDEYGVGDEFKMVFIVAVLCLIIYVILLISPGSEGNVWDDTFDPHLVVILGMNVSFSILTLRPALSTFKLFDNLFLGKKLKRQNGGQELTHHEDINNQTLRGVLNSNTFPIFVEHLKCEFSVENVLFWKTIENLKIAQRKYGHSRQPKHLEVGVATDIYETFIIRGADMEVNISDEVRSKIFQILILEEDGSGVPRPSTAYDRNGSGLQLGDENNMRALTGLRASSLKRQTPHIDVPITIFDEAQNEIFELMERDSLPRFKQSKILKNYLSAMNSSSFGEFEGRGIQMMSSVRGFAKRRQTTGEDERRAKGFSFGDKQSSKSERFTSTHLDRNDVEFEGLEKGGKGSAIMLRGNSSRL